LGSAPGLNWGAVRVPLADAGSATHMGTQAADQRPGSGRGAGWRIVNPRPPSTPSAVSTSETGLSSKAISTAARGPACSRASTRLRRLRRRAPRPAAAPRTWFPGPRPTASSTRSAATNRTRTRLLEEGQAGCWSRSSATASGPPRGAADHQTLEHRRPLPRADAGFRGSAPRRLAASSRDGETAGVLKERPSPARPARRLRGDRPHQRRRPAKASSQPRPSAALLAGWWEAGSARSPRTARPAAAHSTQDLILQVLPRLVDSEHRRGAWSTN